MPRSSKLSFPKKRRAAGDGKSVERIGLSGIRKWKGLLCSVTALFLLMAFSPDAWPQKPADKGALLADRHKAAKVECARCHKDKPAAPVAAAVCSGCHPNVAKEEKIREKLPNPHKAHMEYPDCSDCHHIHKASENQCAGCHNFEFRMR